MAEKLVCGCFPATEEQLEELIDDLLETDIMKFDPMFVEGMLSTITFFTCEEGYEMTGSSPSEFFENAYTTAKRHVLIRMLTEGIGRALEVQDGE